MKDIGDVSEGECEAAAKRVVVFCRSSSARPPLRVIFYTMYRWSGTSVMNI
jgi:hypothetical protein